MTLSIQFKFIDSKDILLNKVIALSDKNKITLGLLPREAIVDHANKSQVLVAHIEEELCGYVLFRINKSNLYIAIVQLCVDSSYRGKNIADELLNIIKEKYKHVFRGIVLNCREDYKAAIKVWLRNGFTARTRKKSRSIKKENFLIKWYFSFEKIDLFDEVFETEASKIKAVLDANILISWSNQEQLGERSVSIEPILSDWVSELTDFYHPKEFHNEIFRDTNVERREFTRLFIKKINIKETKCNSDLYKEAKETLTSLLNPISDNDFSDIAGLSEAIAGKYENFVTNDEGILRNRGIVQQNFKVSILTPYEYAVKIDAVVNNSEYIPQDLSGFNLSVKKLEYSEIDTLSSFFLRSDEKKNDLKDEVKKLLPNTRKSDINVIKEKEVNPIAFWGYFYSENTLHVSFLRVKAKKLDREIFQQVVSSLLEKAITQNKSIIQLSNNLSGNKHEHNILIENGFKNIDGNWVKVIIKDIVSFDELTRTHEIISQHEHLNSLVEEIKLCKSIEQKKHLQLLLERKIWPLKFKDLEIPVIIIPIKAIWASQLFDNLSAKQQLFKSDPLIAWKRENIYYRSVNPNIEKAPARILWYASAEKNAIRQKSVVATSYLDDVAVGTAKSLFKKFQNFGVYKWSHILDLAKGDPEKQIKALLFSDTEVFQRPMSFNEISKTLSNLNYKSNNFVSPLKVGTDIFAEVYSRSV